MLFLYERLAMGVTDRRTEEMDSDAIHFPLRTHEELRSLEAALENQNTGIISSVVRGVSINFRWQDYAT
ncbi:unnamed protein product [Schistosoma curassoni]|uniref:DUF3467 domain-containing protein n=1 Tax=Schistosoma curassoni TaxID=6186 RepID=A0A183KZD0_9TREM|nr:unnamed protein product [Schistosoma curassoni]